MTIYRFTRATSAHTTGADLPAFAWDSAYADRLTVDRGAFLSAEGGTSSGALLGSQGGWTVTVNGAIVSRHAYGVDLLGGNAERSTIKVGADGEIGGFYAGLMLRSTAMVENRGLIAGSEESGVGVLVHGPGQRTIANYVTISGLYSIAAEDGGSQERVTNAGVLRGSVMLGDGADRLDNTGVISRNSLLTDTAIDLGKGGDVLINAGTIWGFVAAGDGADELHNSGLIDGGIGLGAGDDLFVNYRTENGRTVAGSVAGFIDLGAGDDRFLGGANAEIVLEGEGADDIDLGGGDDAYLAVDLSSVDGGDTISGGAGMDTYFAGNATGSVRINLDTVAHTLSPLLPGEGRVAAGTALGFEVAGDGVDQISGFESAVGGSGSDTIYGSAAANHREGGGGGDDLFGSAGNDRLDGGDGLDRLFGSAGKDVLTGGEGLDSFYFTAPGDSGVTAAARDVVTDFSAGADLIALQLIDADSTTAGNQAFTFIGTNVLFSGAAGELRAYHSAGGQIIEGDVNGDGRADFAIELTDPAHLIALGAADFIL